MKTLKKRVYLALFARSRTSSSKQSDVMACLVGAPRLFGLSNHHVSTAISSAAKSGIAGNCVVDCLDVAPDTHRKCRGATQCDGNGIVRGTGLEVIDPGV